MGRRLRLLVGIAFAVIGLALLAWFIALPWYVRRRLIDEAAERGVTLYVGGLSVGWSEIVVSGAVASAADVPGATLTIGKMVVSLRSLSPDMVEVSNASFDVDGQAGVVTSALDRFLASQPSKSSAGGPHRVSLQNARIEWQRALGEGTVLHVGDLGGDIEGDPLGTLGHAHFSGLTVDVGAVSFGPWSATLAKDAKQSEIHVALSPKGPEIGALDVTRKTGEAGFTTEMKVPAATPLTELGLPKPVLGLVSLEGASIAIDATHSERPGEGSGAVRRLRVEGVHLKNAPIAVAIQITDLTYGGPLEKMNVTGGRVSVGPLSGPLEGTLGRPAGGATATLRTTTDIMTCADALGGPLARQLGGLGELLGTSVKGTVSARVEWRVDTRDMRAARLDVVPSASCDLAFLPR